MIVMVAGLVVMFVLVLNLLHAPSTGPQPPVHRKRGHK
jgi:hypothetical protein